MHSNHVLQSLNSVQLTPLRTSSSAVSTSSLQVRTTNSQRRALVNPGITPAWKLSAGAQASAIISNDMRSGNISCLSNRWALCLCLFCTKDVAIQNGNMDCTQWMYNYRIRAPSHINRHTRVHPRIFQCTGVVCARNIVEQWDHRLGPSK